MNTNKCIGSTLETFLQEQGILEEVTTAAIKSTLALQIRDILKELNMSTTELAKSIKMSKAAINRLLDTENSSITLNTLIKLSIALDRDLDIKI